MYWVCNTNSQTRFPSPHPFLGVLICWEEIVLHVLQAVLFKLVVLLNIVLLKWLICYREFHKKLHGYTFCCKCVHISRCIRFVYCWQKVCWNSIVVNTKRDCKKGKPSTKRWASFTAGQSIAGLPCPIVRMRQRKEVERYLKRKTASESSMADNEACKRMCRPVTVTIIWFSSELFYLWWGMFGSSRSQTPRRWSKNRGILCQTADRGKGRKTFKEVMLQVNLYSLRSSWNILSRFYRKYVAVVTKTIKRLVKLISSIQCHIKDVSFVFKGVGRLGVKYITSCALKAQYFVLWQEVIIMFFSFYQFCGCTLTFHSFGTDLSSGERIAVKYPNATFIYPRVQQLLSSKAVT